MGYRIARQIRDFATFKKAISRFNSAHQTRLFKVLRREKIESKEREKSLVYVPIRTSTTNYCKKLIHFKVAKSKSRRYKNKNLAEFCKLQSLYLIVKYFKNIYKID